MTETTKTSKSIKSKGLHEWTKDELIVTFYLTKYGNKNLYLRNENEVSKNLGVTPGSLKMQMCNFNFLLGVKSGSLSDYSELQKEIFDEYNNMNEYYFCKKVKEVIGQDDYERSQILKKMGKDVSKLKLK